jgi:hypothetical protein
VDERDFFDFDPAGSGDDAADVERDEERDENGLTESDYDDMIRAFRIQVLMLWRAARGRLQEAIRRGDRRLLIEALSPDLKRELLPRLRRLPLLDLDERPPRVQISAAETDHERELLIVTLREESRSQLAGLLLDEEGVLEVELGFDVQGVGLVVGLAAAEAPAEGSRLWDVEVGIEAFMPEDYVPPRFRVEPASGEGMWLSQKDLAGALDMAQALSQGGPRYLVFDREGLERKGTLVAQFEDGQRIDAG